MFDDRVKIYVKAGNGGNGKVSFHTRKNIRVGAPDGGDGGRGGDIIIVADKNVTDLGEFRYTKHMKAGDGMGGGPNTATGKTGESVIIKVPCGTIVKDDETQGVLADLFYDGDRVVALQGGQGGAGNAKFKSSRRQSPTFAQTGEITKERTLLLELKTIADVGLVGYPNAGKSTLLSVLTSAKPKIAGYQFTTLSPNLGVCKVKGQSFVIADIPGLIEGASEGAGLGHYFLRHIERTRMLLMVVDISGMEGRDPYEDYKVIKAELKKYNKDLEKLPKIIVLNKMDSYGAEENAQAFMKKLNRLKNPPQVVRISAHTHQNLEELLEKTRVMVAGLPKPEPIKFEKFEFEKADKSAYFISRDDDGAFVIEGGFIDELIRNVVLSDYQSFAYFQKVMKEKGIIKHLRRLGAVDGDTVRIKDFDFEFIDD